MALAHTILFLSISIAFAAPAPAPAQTYPPHGGAFVTTLPAGASAWLDGTYLGQTPVYVDDVLPGSHALTLSRSGWQPQTATFDVFAGRITPVSIVMERVAQSGGADGAKSQGNLCARGGPPGARLFIDGAVAGPMPVQNHPLAAGYHIITLATAGKNPQRMMRVVDIFPDTTTAVQFSAAVPGAPAVNPADDILEALDSYVPASNVVIANNVVTIHYRGVEVECAVGSRTYTFNGRVGTLGVAPTLVAGKIYLPRSLLQRLAQK